MDHFWLADVRREARLLTVGADDMAGALRSLGPTSLMVSLERVRSRLTAQLRPITLVGANPVRFYAARRRDDRHPLIDHLITELTHMPAVHF